MKKTVVWMLALACLLTGCGRQAQDAVKEEKPPVETKQQEPVPDIQAEELRDKVTAAFGEIAGEETFSIIIEDPEEDTADTVAITPENSPNLANREGYLPISFEWSAATKADWAKQMAGETGYVLTLGSEDEADVIRCCEKGDILFCQQDGKICYVRAVNPNEGEPFEGKVYHFFRMLADDAVSHQVWSSVTVDGSITDPNRVAEEFAARVAENYKNVPDWVIWKPLDAKNNGAEVFDAYWGQPQQLCAGMGFGIKVKDLGGEEASYWQAGAGLDKADAEGYCGWGMEVHLMKNEAGDWAYYDRGSGGYAVLLPETGKDGPSLEGLVEAFYLTEGFSHDWLIPYYVLGRVPEQLAELPALLAERTEAERVLFRDTLVQVVGEHPETFPHWSEQQVWELLVPVMPDTPDAEPLPGAAEAPDA